MRQKGFTLIELMVVISIITLLASIVLVTVNGARQKARDAKRLADIHQISTALELYASDNNGTYPTPWFDSRPAAMPPDDWHTFASFLSPKYVSQVPVPPDNGSGDGTMCSNCDGYTYMANANGTGYALCTYLAQPTYSNGTTTYGSYYCSFQSCQAGLGFETCP